MSYNEHSQHNLSECELFLLQQRQMEQLQRRSEAMLEAAETEAWMMDSTQSILEMQQQVRNIEAMQRFHARSPQTSDSDVIDVTPNKPSLFDRMRRLMSGGNQ